MIKYEEKNKIKFKLYCNIPVNTRDTAARVRGVSRCVEIHYCTRTRQTRDLKPAGFPVPVTIPRTHGCDTMELPIPMLHPMCKWVQLTQGELDAHATSIKAQEKSGEVVSKPRKKRLDTGIIHRKQKQADKENMGMKAKRSKASQCAMRKLDRRAHV